MWTQQKHTDDKSIKLLLVKIEIGSIQRDQNTKFQPIAIGKAMSQVRFMKNVYFIHLVIEC